MAKSNCYRALTELSVYWDQQTDENGKVSTWCHLVLTSCECTSFGEKTVFLPGSEWHYSQWLRGEQAKELAEFAAAHGDVMQGLDNAVKLRVSNDDHRKALEDNYPQILCLYSCFGMKQKCDEIVFDNPHIRVDKDGNIIGKKPVMRAKYVYFIGGDASNKGSEYGKEAARERCLQEYASCASLPGEEDVDIDNEHGDTGE